MRPFRKAWHARKWLTEAACAANQHVALGKSLHCTVALQGGWEHAMWIGAGERLAVRLEMRPYGLCRTVRREHKTLSSKRARGSVRCSPAALNGWMSRPQRQTTEREARSDRHAAIEVSCGWNAEEVSCGGSSCNLYARCREHKRMPKTTQSPP